MLRALASSSSAASGLGGNQQNAVGPRVTGGSKALAPVGASGLAGVSAKTAWSEPVAKSVSVPGADQDTGANHRSEASLRAPGPTSINRGGATLRGRFACVSLCPSRPVLGLRGSSGLFRLPSASSSFFLVLQSPVPARVNIFALACLLVRAKGPPPFGDLGHFVDSGCLRSCLAGPGVLRPAEMAAAVGRV